MIAFASDHAGYGLKKIIMEYVSSLGYECTDYGTYDGETVCDYPEFAHKAAKAIMDGTCDRGILFCGTGVGISLAANKVKGIRCCVCSDCYTAKLSKEHNDTNMLALGARVVGPELAKMIVKSWLDASFMGGIHEKRISMPEME